MNKLTILLTSLLLLLSGCSPFGGDSDIRRSPADGHSPKALFEIAKKSSLSPSKLTIIFNKKNLGVGGAVKVGYEKCLSDKSDVVVKIDGDNQMDPAQIEKLVEPILSMNIDYCKGNRFLKMLEIENYPSIRFYGNIFLSFMSTGLSGNLGYAGATLSGSL